MKSRVTFSFALIALLFSCVLAKAFYLQVVNRSKLLAYSQSQVLRTSKIYPKRGQILDRNGSPLAVNVKRYNIFSFVRNLSKTKLAVKRLSKSISAIKRSKVLKALDKRRNKFTWIARDINLTQDQLALVKKMEAVQSEVVFSRFYPNHELASQLLGFVGIDKDGLSGIENYFNKELKGTPIERRYYKDAKGRPVKTEQSLAVAGSKDIKLSIDKEIQGYLELYLKEGVQKHKALRAGGGVMDAETGEVLAIANYPTFDPNFYRASKSKQRRLSFLTDPFEPGSVFKTLTIASALDRDIVKPDTKFYCENGKFKVQNHYITESDSSHKFEWMNVKDILKYSSNIGTTKIAFDLGDKALKEDLLKLNIGKKVGVEVKGESRGIFESKGAMEPLRLSNVSFGQGVATTGIQMLASYTPFANGSYYIAPTFIKGKKNRARKVFKKQTIDSIRSVLVEAVEDGTGKNARVKHFTIAGKTSTAQRIDESGKYNGYTSGFIGFPIGTKKKFVAFIYVEDPKDGYYGNQVAAPIFQKLVKTIIYRNKEYRHLAKSIVGFGDNFDKLTYTAAAPRKKTLAGEIPNLIGLDKKSATSILDKLNIEYETKGYGVVVNQSKNPGEPIVKNMIVKLKFKSPSIE